MAHRGYTRVSAPNSQRGITRQKDLEAPSNDDGLAPCWKQYSVLGVKSRTHMQRNVSVRRRS